MVTSRSGAVGSSSGSRSGIVKAFRYHQTECIAQQAALTRFLQGLSWQKRQDDFRQIRGNLWCGNPEPSPDIFRQERCRDLTADTLLPKGKGEEKVQVTNPGIYRREQRKL